MWWACSKSTCGILSSRRSRRRRPKAFKDKESYYATVLHELTHATRHATRLDRDLGRQRFGDAGYAREELVAELGAAFLCKDLFALEVQTIRMQRDELRERQAKQLKEVQAEFAKERDRYIREHQEAKRRLDDIPKNPSRTNSPTGQGHRCKSFTRLHFSYRRYSYRPHPAQQPRFIETARQATTCR